MIDMTTFAGVRANDHNYTPPGGVTLDTLAIETRDGQHETPVVYFEERDATNRVWAYVVPLHRVQRLWFRVEEADPAEPS